MKEIVMKQKVIIVLFAVVLLLVIGAAGMYASSLLKSRAASEAGGETAAQEVAAVPESDAVPTPDKARTTAPDTNTAVKPPANNSSGGTTPRTVTPSKPNAVGEEPPSRPPFAERGQGGPRDSAFAKLRGKFELMGLFRGLGRLDDLKAPLTEKQAKAILAIMNPLRKQATLSPEEADKALAKLKAELTKAQLDALAQAARERMMRGGPGGGPGGRQRDGAPPNAAGNGGGMPPSGGDSAPGSGDMPRRRGDGGPGGGGPGGGAPGGGGPGGGPGGRGGGGFGAQMETMNPFHPGDDPMSQRMAERINAVFDELEAKAAGK